MNGLLALAELRVFPAEMEIVLKGDDGGAMFIVVEGEAEAATDSPDALDRRGTRFTEGDYFGEMALLRHEHHRADLVAVTDCTVLTITTVLIRMLGHSCPSAGFRLSMAVLDLARERLRSPEQRTNEKRNVVPIHAMARVA